MQIDFNKIDNIVIENVDMKDWPDFCDAYIESCDIDASLLQKSSWMKSMKMENLLTN